MSIVWPVRRWVAPVELREYQPGFLPAWVLSPITGGGKLWTKAAKAWNSMADHAALEGIFLSNVSEGYRTHDRIVQLFLERYSPQPTGRVPQVTRLYQGKTWYLKKGMAPSASPDAPGTAHSWGLAQDINLSQKGTFEWMCRNAPRYGFYLQAPEGSPEAEKWHWQYVLANEPSPDPTPPASFDPGKKIWGDFPFIAKPRLQQGATGDPVRYLQGVLKLKYRITIDGSFGPVTLDRVRTFQREQKIAIDGIVGNQTWSRIDQLAKGK